MNRTALIIISVLCFVTSVSFVYAYVQQGLAKEMQAIANKNSIMAEKNAKEAVEQRKLAEESMRLAEVQRIRAEQAIQDCMSKKK